MKSRNITKNQSREMEAKINRAYHAKIFTVHFLSHLKTGENFDFSVFLHLIVLSKYLPIAIPIVCEYSFTALAYISQAYLCLSLKVGLKHLGFLLSSPYLL